MEESKKNNKGLIIIIVVLAICLVGACSYIVYDKFIAKEDNETKEEASREEEADAIENLDIDSEEVLALYNNITTTYSMCQRVDDYFKADKVTVNDLDFYVVADIVRDRMSEYGITLRNIGDSFTEEEFDSYVKKYFGKEYVYQHQNMGRCAPLVYSADAKKYTVEHEPSCGGVCGISLEPKKITKATKIGNKIELEIKALYLKALTETEPVNYEVYSDKEMTNAISGFIANPGTDITTTPGADSLFSQANDTYKFTFTKEDGNYVFTSSELVS